MKSSVSLLAFLCALSLSAAPAVVSDVVWSQDPDSHVVTVSYSLDRPAIVTVEVLTNGVPLKGITHLMGDVCKLVSANSHSFRWAPECSHPGLYSLPEDSEVRVLAWAKSDPPDYLVASLAVTNDLTYYPDEASLPLGIGHDHYRRTALVLRRVHAKNVTWRMGASANTLGVNQWSSENPHLVTLTRDYYIGVFEFTQGQRIALLQWTSGKFTQGTELENSQRPLDSPRYTDIRGATKGLGWPDADPEVAHAVDAGSILASLRAMTKLDLLDLPTEAQWEFACRGGKTTERYDGSDVEQGAYFPAGGGGWTSASSAGLNALGRYGYNGGQYSSASAHSSTGGTARVGSYLPNDYGLYDMLGNLREWTLDRHGAYPDGPLTDPVGAATGSGRAYRGGGYPDAPYICRAGNRGTTATGSSWDNLGFRVAMEILPEPVSASAEGEE